MKVFPMNIATTQEIIDDIRLGKMVVLVDAEDRENGNPCIRRSLS